MRPQLRPTLDLEAFPEEMRKLARQIQIFVARLNDIPEFTDEPVNMSFSSFASDLEYRASCLADFKGQLKTIAVQRYVNDLSADVVVHMEVMQDALNVFIEVGVPTIRHAQNHTANGLQYLSTVATFFSGVVATALQFSHGAHGSLPDLVSALWISSLIFSVASAINSQLAYHWHAAMYRSPQNHIPWWIAIWITRTPLFFLIVSTITFSAGLCVFTYSSNQPLAVRVIVTTFISITSFALLSVGFWFALERWTFAKTKGNRWLLDVLEEHTGKAAEVTGVAPVKRFASRATLMGVRGIRVFTNSFARFFTNTARRVSDADRRMMEASDASDALEATEPKADSPRSVSRTITSLGTTLVGNNTRMDLHTAALNTGGESRNLGVHGNIEERKLSYLDTTDAEKRQQLGPGPSTERTAPGNELPMDTSDLMPGQYPRPTPRSDFDAGSIKESVQSAPGPGSPRFREKEVRRLPVSDSMASISVPSSSGHMNNASPFARAVLMSSSGAASGSAMLSDTARNEAAAADRPKPQRLKSLVERVIAMNKATSGRAASASRARAEPELAAGARHTSTDNYSATSYAQKARLQSLKPSLANLQITQFLNEHMALVKHMRFSPNGDFLATCSWDRTAIIWKITGSTVELCLKLYHPVSTGGFVNQVEWSPDGQQLLTRTQKGIKVWDPHTGSGQRTVHRGRSMQSVAWMPSGNGFLSVEYVLQRGTDAVLATNLVRLASDGQVIENHKLDRIQIWDTAVMADEVRILVVGALLRTTDHLQPTKSRAEKRLLVYNMKRREIEHQVPLLQEVRNIALSTQTGKIAYALVSNEDKSPPQMWRVDMKTGIKSGERVARLLLVHSYLTKTPVDFAGQSYFGGPSDTFVCSSSKSGEIFIWDRTSATLLHTLRPEDNEVIKNFACNHKPAPGFMLVSGALDGALRIWSSGAPSEFGTPGRQMTESLEP
ncbi:WD40 repeat-like protein [Ceratobasidium sp. AG-I]|nr:WD40 repeat-like protein [Ceratobasidium sp. AG-I]